MSSYTKLIREVVPEVTSDEEARDLEDVMRLTHPTLDHLDRETFSDLAHLAFRALVSRTVQDYLAFIRKEQAR